MTTANVSALEGLSEEKLPRRDWVILPLLAMLTIGLIVTCAEGIARVMFSEGSVGEERCHQIIDPISGVKLDLSCSYWGKAPESRPIEYRFNSGGYRSDTEFGGKLPGTFRIVLIGSSYVMGASTPREKTFAATVPAELARKTGLTVELYNEALPGPPGLPQSIDRRFNEVLAASPNLVLWGLSRWDLKEALSPLPVPDDQSERPSLFVHKFVRLKADVAALDARQASIDLRDVLHSSLDLIKPLFKESKMAFMLQHFLYRSQSIYVSYSISGPDDFAGYLKSVPSPKWQARLGAFDEDVASIQARAAAAGVQLVVVLIPSPPQAAMISMGKWPAGYDPYELDNEVRTVVVRHGATYIDIFPGFRSVPDTQQYFLPVDGHPNARGHAVISELLTKELTSGVVPALKAGLKPQVLARAR